MLMEAVIILWLYLSSLRSSWSITPGLICWLLHGSALIATWVVVVWLWHQAILQQPITLVQISNPFGVKTLYLSHAIHSHCIHLFHRCSYFFHSRIYLKWWEESSFASFCPSVQCPMGSQCSPGAAAVWAHSGTGLAALRQCQGTLTSATWRTSAASTLQAQLSVNMKYLNSDGFLPPGKEELAAFTLELW